MGAGSSSSNDDDSSILESSVKVKIVILGDNRTGKSSLMTRFAKDIFHEGGAPISQEFNVKTLQLDGKDIKVLVVDTHCLRNYIFPGRWYRGCNGVVIVYDVTNEKSFNNLEKFLEYSNIVRGEDIVDRLIIGNKCDLTSERVVEYNTAKEFADKHGIPLVEASAKTGINVDQAFLRLLVAVMKRPSEQSVPSDYVCRCVV